MKQQHPHRDLHESVAALERECAELDERLTRLERRVLKKLFSWSANNGSESLRSRYAVWRAGAREAVQDRVFQLAAQNASVYAGGSAVPPLLTRTGLVAKVPVNAPGRNRTHCELTPHSPALASNTYMRLDVTYLINVRAKMRMQGTWGALMQAWGPLYGQWEYDNGGAGPNPPFAIMQTATGWLIQSYGAPEYGHRRDWINNSMITTELPVEGWITWSVVYRPSITDGRLTVWAQPDGRPEASKVHHVEGPTALKPPPDLAARGPQFRFGAYSYGECAATISDVLLAEVDPQPKSQLH